MQITEEIARKVLTIVDAGLVKGVGNPKAGEMCVEAAVCFALDLPHGDDPACVSRALRLLKIALNDKEWSSNAARGAGLRRVAVAQLGSRGTLDDVEFMKRVAEMTIRKIVPLALRAVATKHHDPKHVLALNLAADECERNPTKAAADAAYAANAAAYAADAAAYAAHAAPNAGYDKVLADFAEDVVQILIEMKAPGCQWLPLTEVM